MVPMNEGGTDLTTPLLLIAMPQVEDRFFRRSVVILLHHSDQGSNGLIINRPTPVPLAEVLGGMEIPWGGADDACAYFGGPVEPQRGTVMFSPGDDGGSPAEAGNEVTTGLIVTHHVADLGRLAPAPPPDLRLFLGYSGWGEGQLMDEILRNDWLTAPLDLGFLFAADPDAVWLNALRSLGVDPAALPIWTRHGDGDAN